MSSSGRRHLYALLLGLNFLGHSCAHAFSTFVQPSKPQIARFSRNLLDGAVHTFPSHSSCSWPCSYSHPPSHLHSKFEDDSAGNILTRRSIISTLLKFPAASACLLPITLASSASADVNYEATSPDLSKPFSVVLSVETNPAKTKLEPTSTPILSEIEIEVRPDWAPIAAQRFYELVQSGFYNDSRFHRVLPGYVAQFGIAADPKLNKEWIFCGTVAGAGSGTSSDNDCKHKPLPDEPRQKDVYNTKGTLSFASSGKNSRQTQVFINLGNNGGPPNFLDAQNFIPFARVIRGMGGDSGTNTVKELNSEYGVMESVSGGLTGSVNQGKAAYYGAEYLDALFPKLSIIRDARVEFK